MLNILKDLLSIESYSGKEQDVYKYIHDLLGDEWLKETDELGNMYLTRGVPKSGKGYPLLNAHMDSVKRYSAVKYGKWDGWEGYNNYGYNRQTPVITQKSLYYKDVGDKLTKSKSYSMVGSVTSACCNCKDYYTCHKYMDVIERTKDDIELEIFFLTQCAQTCFEEVQTSPKNKSLLKEKEEEVVKKFELFYDEKTTKLTSNGTRPMGGDDKCGIAIALQIAKTTTYPLKLFFSVQEEVGCVGVKHAITNSPEWFMDCEYSITCDRKSGNHICVTTGGEFNASNYFIAEIAKWGLVNGVQISLEAGTSSDNFYIKKLTENAINLSAGYYNPHMNTEYVMYNETLRTYKWVKTFIKKTDFRKGN